MEKIDAILEVLEFLVLVFYWGYPYVCTWKYKGNLNKIHKPKISDTSQIASIFSMRGSKSTVTFRKIHIFKWN